MVFQVVRLQSHSTTYSKEKKYKSRYFVKKRSSKYKKKQRYQDAQK